MSPYDEDGENFLPDEEPDSDMISMNPPRWQRWRPSRPVAVASVAVVALASGAGIGYAATHSFTAKGAADTAAVAAAASPATSPSPSPSGAPKSGPGARRGWGAFGGRFGGPGVLGLGGIGQVLHGQVTVPKSGGGYQTLDVQDGTVTAVSTNSVTVKSSDGYSATYVVTSKTVVDAEAAGIGSVQKGDTIFVTATVSGSTATAANILDLTAVKAGRASFGMTQGGGPASPTALPAAVQVPNP